jgi:nucleoid-associated protein YgaU
MNRYKYIINDRIDIKKKRKRRNSSLPPEIPKTTQDYYIVTRAGDRLDNIAYEYYEDASQWWVLAQANHLGKGTFHVPAGIRLRIPAKLELHKLLMRNEQSR